MDFEVFPASGGGCQSGFGDWRIPHREGKVFEHAGGCRLVAVRHARRKGERPGNFAGVRTQPGRRVELHAEVFSGILWSCKPESIGRRSAKRGKTSGVCTKSSRRISEIGGVV